MLRISHILLVGMSLLLTGVTIVRGDDDDDSGIGDSDIEVDSVTDNDEGVLSTTEEEVVGSASDEEDADAGDDDEEEYDDAAKSGHTHKQKTKKIFVPVFVPEKEKKKMKIIAVDKGFYIPGGTQLFGKFKSLKACMKACAGDPTCFQGDFNPWLHKCYKHTNYTACGTSKTHPQFVHFSKVPCTVTDAPRGRVVLGVSVGNGIEEKGVDSLQQCIKKCVNAGRGIPLSVDTAGTQFMFQSCFAIDYDFATHKCFVFGSNFAYIFIGLPMNLYWWTHCAAGTGTETPASQGSILNPTTVHIQFCPRRAG